MTVDGFLVSGLWIEKKNEMKGAARRGDWTKRKRDDARVNEVLLCCFSSFLLFWFSFLFLFSCAMCHVPWTWTRTD